MEKLQIKHIAPYLPYGLKCQLNRLGVFNLDEEYPIPHNDICEITNLVKVGNDWEVEISGSGDCSFGMIGLDEIEIFLRPLSDLYKEIDGEVPADILFPKEFYSLIDFYEEHNRENQIQSFIKDGSNWCEPYSFWEYLFSKYFDVFGLIDKGLAIDKNTIE